MKWIKHPTNKTVITDKLLNAVGIEGYARYYLLAETIAGQVENLYEPSGLTLPKGKWAEYLRLKQKNLVTFLELLTKLGLILFESIENQINITICNLSNLLSKTAISSSKRSPSGWLDQNRIDDLIETSESKNKIQECPIVKASNKGIKHD